MPGNNKALAAAARAKKDESEHWAIGTARL